MNRETSVSDRDPSTRGRPCAISSTNPALSNSAQDNLANDIGMHVDGVGVEQSREFPVMSAQVADPDGRIDEDQARSGRRLGAASMSGSLPPSRASLRPLSRAISAFSASRIRPDFSFRPVSSCARASSSSSSANVVRIASDPFGAGFRRMMTISSTAESPSIRHLRDCIHFVYHHCCRGRCRHASAFVEVGKFARACGFRKALTAEIGVSDGQKVEVRAEGGRIIVEPVRKTLTLEQMMENVTPEAMREAWDWGDDVGREIVDD